MTKFQNKYRVESTRLEKWDYGNNGRYFITICTKNFLYYFGEIINDEMQLSLNGKIAENCWLEIPEHFKNITLNAYVIMPNHIHGIISILKDFDYKYDQSESEINRFGNIGHNNIFTIIGSYKSAVSKLIHKKGRDFEWQKGFYDNIIKSDKAFSFITNYIEFNPMKWNKDKFYPKNN